jgi:hypothetical protein
MNNGHQPTAPALWAARTLDKNFLYVPRGQYAATVENLAKVIDATTRLPVLVPKITQFVKDNPWKNPRSMQMRHELHEAGLANELSVIDSPYTRQVRLEDNLDQLQAGVRELEEVYDGLPQYEDQRPGHFPSALARNAQKNLYELWNWVGVKQKRVQLTLRNVAVIVDICTNLFRVVDDCHWLCKQSPWMDRHELARRLNVMRRGLRVFELMKNRLPSAASDETQRTVFLDFGDIEHEMNEQQRRELRELSERLAEARSPDQEQQILRDWQVHAAPR